MYHCQEEYNQLFEFVSDRYQLAKQRLNQVEDRIVISILVYQYLSFLYEVHPIPNVEDIYCIENGDIGLIGPGHGCLTVLFECLCQKSKVFKLHAVLHDAFGRFYKRYKKSRGYCYAFSHQKAWLSSSPLLGHLSGFWFCLKKIYYDKKSLLESAS